VSFTDTDFLCAFTDAGYRSDPNSSKSQTGSVIMAAGAAISWESTKQKMVTDSTCHSEIIALCDTVRDVIWLRKVIDFIRVSINPEDDSPLPPTIVFEDNQATIAQIENGYQLTERTKHIDPKYHLILEKYNEKVKILYMRSDKNTADIFTKSLGAIQYKILRSQLGLRLRKDVVKNDLYVKDID
jgi:hypothetical protein